MNNEKRYLKNKHLIGTRFGKLVVIDFIVEHKNKPAYLCQCDCGNKIEVLKDRLTAKHTKSCGCLRKSFRINTNNDTSFKKTLSSYKDSARKRNLEFKLSDEEFKNITQQNCFYCGISPSNIARHSFHQPPFIYNGVDRKDNQVSYTLDNCVPCCDICNKAKRDLPFEIFIQWINRIKDKK